MTPLPPPSSVLSLPETERFQFPAARLILTFPVNNVGVRKAGDLEEEEREKQKRGRNTLKDTERELRR